ncbi:MAG TPA: 16S rRNA (cytidine(1402)-2'-O)-methyltransferase [Pseudorhodoplanes sp.]|nr:16S rRNA (cytidine(1402)-2'-O)-methyltransferase [Pseudorhodoplanes sp.]
MTKRDAPKRYFLAGHPVEVPPLPGGLYLVSTPIGNLGDITLRALATLAAADAIACEDTRVTRKLLDHFGIAAAMIAYHEHNAESARPKILGRLSVGQSVALVSDAGTPLISDPGYKLVVAARETGHAVIAVPGPSALLAALTSAGLPTDRFFFEGFLPAKAAQRRTRIAELAGVAATIVLYESGPRLEDTLADLAAQLGDREAAICRELTKLHEEIRKDTLPSLARHYASAGAERRGEFVIVIAPPTANVSRLSEEETDDLIRAALARGSVKDAAAEVAAATGLPKRGIYQRALILAREQDDGGRR